MTDTQASALAALYPSAAPAAEPARAAPATAKLVQAAPAAQETKAAAVQEKPPAVEQETKPAAAEEKEVPPWLKPRLGWKASDEAPAEPEPDEPEAAPGANLYFDPVATKDRVDYREPVAAASDMKFNESLYKHADLTEAGDAERATLADALSAAGAGTTLAKELYADAARATKPNYVPTTAEACETELRGLWGKGYDTKLAGVMKLVKSASDVDPNIVTFLNSTGLGNDPALIRKLANRVAATKRK